MVDEAKIIKVLAYVRVSTEDQAKRHTDVNQENAIRRFVESHPEIVIVRWYSDKGISGENTARPEFLEMVKQIDEVDGLLVYDISRAYRNAEYWNYIMFSLRNKKKMLIKAKNGEVSDYNRDRTKIITDFIEGWQAEEELHNTKQRIKEGVKRYRGIHCRWGPISPIIDWEKYDHYMTYYKPPMPITLICQMQDIAYVLNDKGERVYRDGKDGRKNGVSRSLLYKKLQERGQHKNTIGGNGDPSAGKRV